MLIQCTKFDKHACVFFFKRMKWTTIHTQAQQRCNKLHKGIKMAEMHSREEETGKQVHVVHRNNFYSHLQKILQRAPIFF